MRKLFNSRSTVLFIVFFWGLACAYGDNLKKIDDNRDDNGDTNEDSKDEGMDIPADSESNNASCARRHNSLLHEIRPASIRQFPFVAALMSNLDDYLCSGTVVSNGMILTTAACTKRSIGYALLNTTKAKKEDPAVVLHVIKTEKFPTYTGTESLKDVAIVYTEKHNSSVASQLKVSNYTDTKKLVDIEAFGFGLNNDISQTKQLQYVGLENRTPFEVGNVFEGYIDCIDTQVVTCFKDTGGPIVFDNELIGIVTSGQDECSKELTSAYAINKIMVKALPSYAFKAWLDERIKANEQGSALKLMTFPSKPLKMRQVGVKSRAKTGYRSASDKSCGAQNVFTYIAMFSLLY